MSAVELLDRLDGVRETGPDRWLARCPSHEDRSPSLSVRRVEDRLLVHCFAGCDAADVLAAVGLSLSDLFDRPIEHHRPPTKRRIPASDALAAIDFEANVVAVIASDFLQHREIDEPTFQRLAQAVVTIGAARDVSCPAKLRRAG